MVKMYGYENYQEKQKEVNAVGNSSAKKREKIRGLIPNIFAVCRFMQHKSTSATVMMLY